MPYVRLPLPDTKVSAAISMFTEGYLEQAHYLLGVTYPGEGPSNHFGPSAAVMTLLAIAAASRLRIFDPARNNKRPGTKDDEAFIVCVRQFFPWPDVTIVDDKHRSIDAMRQAAAEELYKFFRNPLVHSGGVTGKAELSGKIGDWYRTPQICHVYPGLSPAENEQKIAERCTEPLARDTLIELGAFASKVYTLTLYLCERRMIEQMAGDKKVRQDIAAALGL
jgi:hypothetical protein